MALALCLAVFPGESQIVAVVSWAGVDARFLERECRHDPEPARELGGVAASVLDGGTGLDLKFEAKGVHWLKRKCAGAALVCRGS
jgi:hypothetical protein